MFKLDSHEPYGDNVDVVYGVTFDVGYEYTLDDRVGRLQICGCVFRLYVDVCVGACHGGGKGKLAITVCVGLSRQQ